MANARGGSVVFVDTDGTALPEVKEVTGIKYIGATTSSVTIHGDNSATGPTLWTDNGTTTKFENAQFQDLRGMYVSITGTATVYIYTRATRSGN